MNKTILTMYNKSIVKIINTRTYFTKNKIFLQYVILAKLLIKLFEKLFGDVS